MSEVATETTSTESGSESTNYLGDAFGDYLEANVDDDKTDEENPQGNNPEEKPVEEPQPKTNGENKPESETKDIFQLAFEGANGDLDYEKIMSTSFGEGQQFQQLPIETAPETPATTPEQEIEQERVFRENFTTARTAPLQRAYDLLNSGMDAETALQTAYKEIMEETSKFFKEREDSQFSQRSKEKLEQIEREAKEVARESRLTEISRSNALSIVNTLPGNSHESKVALYNHIMFSDEAGGALLEDMFTNAFPDFEKMSKEDLDKAKRSFINRLQSDPARLKRHFDRAYRLLAASPANLKRFGQQIAKNKEAQVRGNALAAQKAPQGAVQRPPKAQSNSAMGDWLQSDFPKTRI